MCRLLYALTNSMDHVSQPLDTVVNIALETLVNIQESCRLASQVLCLAEHSTFPFPFEHHD